MSCGWFFCASGYYRYDEGFTPEFPGRERFTGPDRAPAALATKTWTTAASEW